MQFTNLRPEECASLVDSINPGEWTSPRILPPQRNVSPKVMPTKGFGVADKMPQCRIVFRHGGAPVCCVTQFHPPRYRNIKTLAWYRCCGVTSFSAGSERLQGGASGEPVILKSWKPEILGELGRVPAFQFFRFSPAWFLITSPCGLT